MAKKSPGSRFANSTDEVVWLDESEKVIPGERPARDIAKLFAPAKAGPRYLKDKAAYREAVRTNNERSHVHDDSEVSTDAVTAVTQISADGWSARWVLAEQDGKPVARSLTLEPTTRETPGSGITTNLLRELSPARAAQIAGERIQNPSTSDPWPVDLGIKWARRDVAEFGPAPSSRGAGRPKLADELLRNIAMAYLEELGNGRGVLNRMSARFGRPGPTLRDWIRASRERGWLSAAPKQGKSGGTPGPLLLAELTQEEEGKNE